MTDPALEVPKEGAESGEQPEEQPNRLVMETWSKRPDRQPKRMGRNGERMQERDRRDSATRTLCSLPPARNQCWIRNCSDATAVTTCVEPDRDGKAQQ